MSKSGHPKFIGLTLTANGGMLGAWEDGSVARWVPTYRDEDTDEKIPGHWLAIPSPDYETLFCTEAK